MRYLHRLLYLSLVAGTLAATSPAAAQGTPTPPRADSAALDSLRVELVRSRGFLRAAETQLSKTLDLLDSLRARVPAPSEPAPPDTVWIPSPPDTVRDTLRVEVPCNCEPLLDPDEPEPEPQEPVDPEPPAPRDSIIAWSPIVEPPARYDTLAVGDTVRLTVVAAGVTVITPEGERITRAATWDEITSAGFRWIHSGVGERYNEAPDGTAVTFRSTGLYGSRITHVTLMSSEGRNLWRLVVTNVEGDGSPLPPVEPDPIEEPDDPPVLDPCDDCPEPLPLHVADSLSTALEFDGVTIHEVGISYRVDPLPSYPCARLVEGVSASVVGDTVRVVQVQGTSERLWCIPYNWPAITSGDEDRARTYPAQPHGERAWYREP